MVTTDELRTADEVGTQLLRVVRLVERVQARYYAEHPDTVDRATYLLLVHLVKGGAQRAVALAEEVHSDPSTISRQVAQLVRLGLVERVADPEDGRACLLVATGEGRRVFDENRRLRNQRIAELMTDWPDAERHTLARLLTRFTDAFESYLQQGPDPAAPTGGPGRPDGPAGTTPHPTP